MIQQQQVNIENSKMRASLNSNDEMFVAEAVAGAVCIEPILVPVIESVGEVLEVTIVAGSMGEVLVVEIVVVVEVFIVVGSIGEVLVVEIVVVVEVTVVVAGSGHGGSGHAHAPPSCTPPHVQPRPSH